MTTPLEGVERILGNPTTKRIKLATVLLAAVLATPGFAQNAAQNIHSVEITINPGRHAPLEAFLAEYKDAVLKAGDERIWLVSTNAIGPVTSYSIAEPLPSFDALGATPDFLASMMQIFDQDTAADIAQSLTGVIAETKSRAWITRPDLARPPDPDRRVVGFTVMYIDVKRGDERAFEDYMKALVEASHKLDDAHWTASTGAPGAPSDYMVTQPIYKWSDLDDPAVRTLRERLIEAFGEQDGARRYASGTAAIEHITSSLVRSRPELSRLPDN